MNASRSSSLTMDGIIIRITELSPVLNATNFELRKEMREQLVADRLSKVL